MNKIQNHHRYCHRQNVCMVLFFTLLSSFFLSCAKNPQPQIDDQNLVYLEKELSEANRKIEEIYHRVSVIQFMVDNHEKAIRDMEKKSGITSSPKKPSGAASASPEAAGGSSLSGNTKEPPEVIYNLARKAYNSQKFSEAADYFDQFIKKYPDHELADNAIYWRGESFYAQKNFTSAIKQFQQLIDNYPNGSKVPDALLKTGYSYLSLKDYENGRKYLRKVTRNYPFSPAASKAAEMLKNL